VRSCGSPGLAYHPGAALMPLSRRHPAVGPIPSALREGQEGKTK
jgi:hypothetical protein